MKLQNVINALYSLARIEKDLDTKNELLIIISRLEKEGITEN